jgi:hypothetical protein
MRQKCPTCGETYGPEIGFCPNCICELVADVAEEASPPAEPPVVGPLPAEEPVVVPPPAQVDGEPWTTAVCWNCARPSPNPANTLCLEVDCRRPLIPPELVVRFRYGQIELRRGERTTLGRLGRYADTVLPYPNVSRTHTNIGVEPDGKAWIEPLKAAVNGTFLNDREIVAPDKRDLRNKDALRLGRDCTGTVLVYAIGGDPA